MHSPKSLLVLVLLSTTACKNGGGSGSGSIAREQAPTQYAQTYCELLASCGCELPFVSVDECVDMSSTEFETELMGAESMGMIYDGACLAMLLDRYVDDLGCKTATQLIEDGTFEGQGPTTCKVLYGTATEGQPCSSVLSTVFGDSCVQGLFCIDGVCESTTSVYKQLGEVCDPQSQGCVSGAICTNSPAAPDTFTCTDLPGLGQSCADLPVCEVGLGCDPSDNMCKGPVGAGEACGALPCQEGLWCDSTCVPTLADGEPCMFNGQCGQGSECATGDSGDVCMPEQPVVCP